MLLSWLVCAATGAPLDPEAFASLGTWAPTANASIDTDALTLTGGYTGVESGGVAVFDFDDVLLDGVTITIRGSRPVAILSRGDLELSLTTIDARAAFAVPGPGGYPGGTGAGAGPGAGAAGTSIACGGGGGHGGSGGQGQLGLPGGFPYGDARQALTGGSSGGGFASVYAGGAGGGAVELGAIGTLTIDATSAVDVSGGISVHPNAGGGAGGMILLHASTAVISGSLLAHGGNATVAGGGGGGGGHICQSVPIPGATVDLAGGVGYAAGRLGVSCTSDADGDGFPWHLDCADHDPARHPGALDVCGSGVDEDCSGVADDQPNLSDPTPGTAGVLNAAEVTCATPGSTVALAWAWSLGSSPIPGCPTMSSLDQPTLLAVRAADGTGRASFTGLAPAGLAGRTLALQAVEIGTCRPSNTVEPTF
ncbi:MAG: putative metal-binding motif-containing protein [Alphaproteobacteria bacterium]|nr:putative metal-binding motif-containing protein [Alphaproteobacteria bacterium]